MKQTEKIMEVMIDQTRWLVIKDNRETSNPYKVYHKWWDGGWHRKKVTEYADLRSVFYTLMRASDTIDGWLDFDKYGREIRH